MKERVLAVVLCVSICAAVLGGYGALAAVANPPAAASGAQAQTGGQTAVDDITTSGGYSIARSDLAHVDSASDAKVYFTSDISPEAMLELYAALGREVTGTVAVKLSTGEAGDHYYLDPNLIKDLVQRVDGTIVECNTAYGGSRASTAMHMQVAEDHGFTAIADVDIMDADGSMRLPITGGNQLTETLVGSHLANYDSVLVLSHFKGHAMAGFGGALKNISIGIGSSQGKALIHGAGDLSNIWGASQVDFTESMAEAAKAVSDYESDGEDMLYINVMNNLSVDCDCDSSPAAPTMEDIGMLASTDPVALDQACVDLVYAVPDGADLIERMESRTGIHILEHAEAIGLGSRSYSLEDLDVASAGLTIRGSGNADHLLLRGQWAGDGKATLTLLDGSRNVVPATNATWSIAAGSAAGYGFASDCAAVDASGTLSVLSSGVCTVRAVYGGQTAELPLVVPGDYNRDGRVNTADLTMAIDVVTEDAALDPAPYSLELLDMNGNGRLNTADVSLLVSAVQDGIAQRAGHA